MSKKARLDALEAAYLTLREDHKRLRDLTSGIFDLVTACSENIERLQKWADVHGRAGDLELKSNLNTLANINQRLLTRIDVENDLEARITRLEQPEAGPAQRKERERTELADMKVSGWERQALEYRQPIGDPPPRAGTSVAVERDIAEQRRINEDLANQADWIAKNCPPQKDGCIHSYKPECPDHPEGCTDSAAP